MSDGNPMLKRSGGSSLPILATMAAALGAGSFTGVVRADRALSGKPGCRSAGCRTLVDCMCPCRRCKAECGARKGGSRG